LLTKAETRFNLPEKGACKRRFERCGATLLIVAALGGRPAMRSSGRVSRSPWFVWALAASALALSATASHAAPATPASANGGYQVPMTSFGQPDFGGDWNNATLTPLVRPKVLGMRLTLTPEEAAKIEKGEASAKTEGLKPTDPKLKVKDLPYNCGKGFKGVDCGYNAFWTDSGDHLIHIDGLARTSIINDPPTGQFPPMTPEGQARAMKIFSAARGKGPHAYDNPESRSLGERCITSFGSSAGPPMLPLLYNNNYEIVQTPDSIAILVEMVHDVRVIKLNGQHAPSNIKSWMGDSIGHWEGKTLVIETTNIRREQALYGMGSDEFKVVERLTRISPQQILYQFTVSDPKTFKQPLSGEETFNATKGPIYEYACHEGNYALPHILAGARAKEKQGLPYDVDVKDASGTPPVPGQGEGSEQ
jgi:hypothetical protein